MKTAYKINRPVATVHHRRYRRRRRLAGLLIGLIALIGLAFWLDLVHQAHTTSRTVGSAIHSNIAGPATIRSPYFEFTSADKWVYAPNDSTPTKLTYLLYEDGVPAHSLTVYVNQTPLDYDLAVTHVLPVQIAGGNTLVPQGDISAACGTLYKPTDLKRIRTVALDGTNMLCVPDSPQFTVIVGLVGGDYNLELRRSNGAMARYIIIYHNLSVNPDPSPFTRIMGTFKAL